jgi:hypothetical protein
VATPNQLSSLPFQNNAILNGLNKPDNSKLVYDLSGGFNVIDFIVTRNAPARQISGLNGVFNKPIMGRSDVGVQISSNSASGNNLIINFSDVTFQNFRVTEVISDGTAANNQGRVIAVAPGTVTVEPVSGATSVPNTSFVAGAYASRMFQASVNHGSNGIASLYEDPIYVSNQTSIIRESLDIYRRDSFQTWVEYDGDYWIHSQEPITMKRFARGLERKAIFGRMGTNTTTAAGGGTVNYSMGLKDSILNPLRGGVYMGLTGTMTEGQFQNWISQIADRKNSTNYKITLGVGRGFLAMVQNFVRPFIQFGGSANTFNHGPSSIKGLDAYFYAFNGVEVEMIMIPMFNDREQFPAMSTLPGLGNYTRMQYTAIAFDTEMYPSMGGGMLPAMEKVYWGSQETLYGYLRGMTDVGSGNVPNLSTSGYINLATDRDAVSIQIYSDCAFDFMSYRMGWAEVLA